MTESRRGHRPTTSETPPNLGLQRPSTSLALGFAAEAWYDGRTNSRSRLGLKMRAFAFTFTFMTLALAACGSSINGQGTGGAGGDQPLPGAAGESAAGNDPSAQCFPCEGYWICGGDVTRIDLVPETDGCLLSGLPGRNLL